MQPERKPYRPRSGAHGESDTFEGRHEGMPTLPAPPPPTPPPSPLLVIFTSYLKVTSVYAGYASPLMRLMARGGSLDSTSAARSS